MIPKTQIKRLERDVRQVSKTLNEISQAEWFKNDLDSVEEDLDRYMQEEDDEKPTKAQLKILKKLKDEVSGMQSDFENIIDGARY